MPTRTRAIVFNIEDPQINGLLRDFDSDARGNQQVFVWGDTESIFLRPVRPSTSGVRRWDDAYASGMTAHVAISAGNVAPTDGTFSVIVSNNSTAGSAETDPIDAAATAMDVQNAINAVCEGLGLLGVEVTKSGVDYLIYAAAGEVNLILADGDNNLTPECHVKVKELRDATADLQGAWRIRVAQNGYASTTSTTPFSVITGDVTGTVTSVQTGTSSLPSIQRIKLDPPPISGSWSVAFSRAQALRVQTKDSTDAAYAVYTVQAIADTSGSLNEKYFDVYLGTALYRVWMNDGLGTAPDAAGGTLVEVTYTQNMTAAQIATRIAVGMDPEPAFAVVSNSNLVTITASSYSDGGRVEAGTSGFTVSTYTEGSLGSLHNTSFIISDSVGTVGVWFAADVGTTTPPTGVAACTRTVRIQTLPGDSAADLASYIATALDADSEFISTAASDVATITAASVGERSEPADVNSNFGISVTSSGVSASGVVPYNATADQVQVVLGNFFSVENTSAGVYELTATENGAQSNVTVTVTGLKAPQGILTQLDCDTVAAAQAFAASTAEYLEPKLCITITYSGESPKTGLLAPCRFYRDFDTAV